MRRKKTALVRKPRFADQKYMGEEPATLGKKFDPTRINVARAYNWYNYYYESKDAKSWALEYVKIGNTGKPPKQKYSDDQLKAFIRLDHQYVPMWLGAACKMLMAGCPMPAGTFEALHAKIEELIASAPEPTPVAMKIMQLPVSRDLPIITKFEGVLDEFYNSDYKNVEINPYDTLREMGARPSDAVALINFYKPLHDEVMKGGEGYTHLTTRQKNRYVALLQKILEDAKLFSSNMRKSSKVRKPRKRKVKSAEQVTSKVKFKTEDSKLKLVSQAPSAIVGATAVWLYNTKHRELTYLEGTLSIQGTTVKGFDPKKSMRRKIRKPEILGPMMKLGKVAALKEFNKLKVKPAAARGRINADMMILRVVK